MHWRDCPCEKCSEKRVVATAKASAAAVLRAQGVTLPRIAMALGMSQPKICQLLKEARGHTA
jgi:predicted transcriptional regulator